MYVYIMYIYIYIYIFGKGGVQSYHMNTFRKNKY